MLRRLGQPPYIWRMMVFICIQAAVGLKQLARSDDVGALLCQAKKVAM